MILFRIGALLVIAAVLVLVRLARARLLEIGGVALVLSFEFVGFHGDDSGTFG